MRRAFTLVETVVAFAIGVVILIMVIELVRYVSRMGYLIGKRQATQHNSSFLMERVVGDLEAALPEKTWTAGPTPPTFLENEAAYAADGNRYNTGFALRRAPANGTGRVTPQLVAYAYDQRDLKVTRTVDGKPDPSTPFSGIELFVVAPYKLANRQMFRVLVCAREANPNMKVRALPLTATVCPRFLRAHQALPYWSWPAGEWESLVSP